MSDRLRWAKRETLFRFHRAPPPPAANVSCIRERLSHTHGLMNEPLVSAVIPTYKRAYCIERAVDSALNQTHPRIEVVVVDDGSPDETSALLERRYGSDARVVRIRQENGGVAAARNTGLRAARGDFVGLLDSDDLWKPWKIELQLRCLERVPEAGMVWTDMEALGPDGGFISERYLERMYWHSYRRYSKETLFDCSAPLAEIVPGLRSVAGDERLYWGDIFSPMVMGNLVHTSTVLLRRERLERVVGFDEALKHSGEDYDFHLRTCREGPVAYADVSSIAYQVGGEDQLTHARYGSYMAKNFLTTVTQAIEADRGRGQIKLPAGMLDDVRAHAHEWVGDAAFRAGNHAEARSHLWASLQFRPGQPYTWLRLAAALAPYPLVESMRKLRRRARRR